MWVHLLSHFPTKIKSDKVTYHSAPPSCPPSFNCSAQFGDIYFIVNKPDYKEELKELLKGQISYKTAYSDSNIILNLTELRQNIFPVEKCNKLYINKMPIPYFESYNFGLGEIDAKKEVNDQLYFDYSYSVPSDLEVYVIQAEAGDFWKESCNEKRPEALKEWQHGYSKGFAISDKANIIVYWVMIW